MFAERGWISVSIPTEATPVIVPLGLNTTTAAEFATVNIVVLQSDCGQ